MIKSKGKSVIQALVDWDTIKVGIGTVIVEPANIYNCIIGEECRIGPFVEIQANVCIGNRVKIGSHSFICAGTIIEDEVLIAHGVMFCNDKWPRGTLDGKLKTAADWKCEPVTIRRGASIGSGAVLLPGIIIGAGAMVGAGAVVTRCVPKGTTVAGNPARQLRRE